MSLDSSDRTEGTNRLRAERSKNEHGRVLPLVGELATIIARGLEVRRLHDLRRSGGRHLIPAGVDPHTVMAFSGDRPPLDAEALPHHRPGRSPRRGCKGRSYGGESAKIVALASGTRRETRRVNVSGQAWLSCESTNPAES